MIKTRAVIVIRRDSGASKIVSKIFPAATNWPAIMPIHAITINPDARSLASGPYWTSRISGKV